ncbi:MAG: hypothetical protein RI934_1090 [Bacteroidota bacterium]|jgi:hypothetical protein
MPKFRCLFFLCLLICSNAANANFVFNDNCIRAYKNILSLKFNEGVLQIQQEKKINPNNKIPVLLENYIDFLKVLTTETNASFETLKSNKSKRLDLIASDDANSPWYLYVEAEINLQSCINRFKYQEFISGAYELQKAYKLLEENQRKFPEFLPNKKSFALLYGLIGMVPEQYKWALSSIGLKGNVEQGTAMLEDLTQKLPKSSYAFLYDESAFFLSFIYLSKEGDLGAFDKIKNVCDVIPKSNLLGVYIKALAASKTGHTDEAIELLMERPKSNAYASFYHLDYLLGICKINRFDNDAANYFESYLKNYTGGFNVKDAYLKIAWFHLLRGNIDKYNAYISLCKVRGQAISEKDKDAQNLCLQVYPPDLALLKARLYFDGGYYDKALLSLKDKKANSFTLTKEKLEYLYRLGRIYHQQNKTEQAIMFYTSTVSAGLNLPYYFAANASLQLGYIYEYKKNYPKAQYYFSLCSQMKNEEYKNSIETKAKAGLRRISKR